MKKNTRSGVVALALLGLVGAGYFAYTANRPPAKVPASVAAESSAQAVEVAMVKAVDFADDAQAVGTLKSAESVMLRPETAGRVAAINFRDGAVVTKGTVLISLDAAIQEAELLQAKANLALAESSHRRNQELLEKKFISPQALDNSQATLKIQSAAVRLAEAKVAQMRIRAPFDGVVGLRNVSVGDYVQQGQDLVNIEDIATLRADFRLPESYVSRLRQGMELEATSDALPGERFRARLEAVDPLVDQAGRSLSARARLDNQSGKLRPGMFMRLRVLLGDRQAALMVPEQAIIPGGQPAVFRVVDGKAQWVQVRLGVRRAAQVEIVEGLAAGDVVVTAGQLRLRDGTPVRAVGEIGEGTPATSANSP
ncbi:MAG: efflux RND transporter periplasmic adaptor subunit [Azonexus sp.]|jgi:membrane fusion protein (multidrug efflux system)|uniref:efflux RND transporter periplasmic adaptor subunit n=1 Tax=Azonexus sp. TaxID=1872668 RepID=UPI0028285D2A|nr:efflux RND transporter periplasmic adaptor subunit [Azonexus sp.]MDR0775446.1 efflux RND transporter periplasmic adaptor subunit [Azonexus sp.]